MNKQRLALVLALAVFVSMSATAFAASNPFADVPADHWAYDSIIELAAVGLIEGYPDGTFGGSRMLTRYEAAMVFARSLARLEALIEAGVKEETAGVQDEILNKLLAQLESTKAELVDLIEQKLADLEIPVMEVPVVEKTTIVEQPIEKIIERQPIERPFQLTPEAEAMISELVGDLAAEYLADAEALAKEALAKADALEQALAGVPAIDEDTVRKIAEEVLAYSLSDLEADIDKALRQNLFQDRRLDGLARNAATKDDLKELNERLAAVVAGQDALAADLAATNSDISALQDAVRGDIAALEKAIDEKVGKVAEDIAALAEEFNHELSLLGLRVEALELVFDNLDKRVTALENKVEDVEEQLVTVDERLVKVEEATERVKLSGSTSFEGSKTDIALNDSVKDSYFGLNTDADTISEGVDVSQKANWNLSIKASDDVTVNAFAESNIKFAEKDLTLDKFGVEVLSNTPISRLVAGSLTKDDITKNFNGYVLSPVPSFGLLADVGFGGIETNVVAGRVKNDTEPHDDVVGLAAKYSFVPEFGLKVAATKLYNAEETFDGTTANAAGVFGEVFGLTYDATVALDNYANDPTDNWLVDVNVGSDFDFIALDFNWAKARENFGIGNLVDAGFINGDARSKLAVGAESEIFGVDLAADWYQEKDNAGEQVLQAKQLTADTEIDVLMPITLSAVLGTYKDGALDAKGYSKFAIGLADMNLLNTDATWGTSFTVVNNYRKGDWKNPDNYTEADFYVLAANVDYGFAWSGAAVDLGYDFEMAIPRKDTKDTYGNQVSHEIGAGYAFTDNAKLNLSAKRITWDIKAPAEETQEIKQVKAGLEFNF